jgi:hypothetical protein
MKIYVLLMLIAVIVGFSQLPIRRAAKAPPPVAPDSIAARV